VLNELDRFHLVMDVLDRVAVPAERGALLRQQMVDRLTAHRAYVCEFGEDQAEIREWRWPH
jgi:xylulose-5-phosphate/fructose-6-phosphate phosphoketolase